MSNTTEAGLTDQQLLFIDRLSSLLMPWGMNVGVSRLFAYLLLQAEAVSLDRICADLGVSKSTASVSARNLENANMIRRHRVRGSKRVLYSSVEDTSAKMKEHAEMLGKFAALMQLPDLVKSQKANKNMRDYGEFCLFMQRAINAALEEWQAL